MNEVWYHVYTNDGTDNFGFAIQFNSNINKWVVIKCPQRENHSLVATVYHQSLIDKGYEVIKVNANVSSERSGEE